ncbi:MAG: type I polyketide synthase [Candidatus Hydrogenedentes bacterium]|nr:type I polyketide synthase [Candidatus Hydrogenedentota bacterium]
MHKRTPIAIVGLGAAFPDAPSAAQFWENIAAGRVSTRDVPPGRWSVAPDRCFTPGDARPDRVYATQGCFLDLAQCPLDHDILDISPEAAAQLDPVFHVLLYAAQQAFLDAGAQTGNLDRTGLIVGNLVLPTESASRIAWEYLGAAFEERLLGKTAIQPRTDLRNLHSAGLPAAVAANALGLGGAAFTLDAACASSLYAIKLAASELQAGKADMMLAGGVSRPDPLFTQMGFSQLRALSPEGRCAPFSHDGKGLIVGEGSGIFVLKRLDDALQAHDRIYAVLRGAGLSNDVGGKLLAPTSEGQLRAMRAAYAEAGWSPHDVDLIECHATGTPVGDAVELASLNTLWEAADWKPGQCVLGSVKSNIGHCLTAAGAAAMIKVLLAMRHETLPPTASFSAPADAAQFSTSPFRVTKNSAPWPLRDGERTRKAAVSAFGFGGINAHILLESWDPAGTEANRGSIGTALPKKVPERIAIVGMDGTAGPWTSLRALRERLFNVETGHEPEPFQDWWGLDASSAFQAHHGKALPEGFGISTVDVPINRFRIPPKELEEALPQQLLMLQTAANAWEDARGTGDDAARTGVFIGLGLDPNCTNFSVRWQIANQVDHWAQAQGLHLDDTARAGWLSELRDAAGPALNANRVMGNLGSVVASRIARELRLGGPSFTVSAEDNSGIAALQTAARLLHEGVIDTAIAGAVDFPGDARAAMAHQQDNGAETPLILAEGAVAFVLKRESDARAAGDPIYALLSDVALAATQAAEDLPLHTCGYWEIAATHSESLVDAVRRASAHSLPPSGEHAEDDRCYLGNHKLDIGHAGCATGLFAVLKSALALYHHVQPAMNAPALLEMETQSQSYFHVPATSRHWLHNRAQGPRRAAILTPGLGGRQGGVLLEADATAPRDTGALFGERSEALFVLAGKDGATLLKQISALQDMADNLTPCSIECLARAWWRKHRHTQPARLRLACVAQSAHELNKQLDMARAHLEERPDEPLNTGQTKPELAFKDRVFYSPAPLAESGHIAFVFPGSGNHFPGMGRELLLHWPAIAHRQDNENAHLRSQFQPNIFWDGVPMDAINQNHMAMIFGQVTLGTAVSDLMRLFGAEPKAVIGYSLGETAGFFSLRVWRDRDAMLTRMKGSPLFTEELAGECTAAKKRWELPGSEAVDWVLGVIDRPMQVARKALKNRKKVYPLITNTLHESVIGGNRQAVEKLIAKLQCQFIPLEGVTTVHCEIVEEVKEDYRGLHLFDCFPPEGVRFYSGAWGKSYTVTRDSAADSILANAIEGVDFPAVIESAYKDGARLFIELGPGNSCARMISRILGNTPHLSRAFCAPGQPALTQVLRGLGALAVEGVNIDLAPLYDASDAEAPDTHGIVVSVPTGAPPFTPPLPRKVAVVTEAAAPLVARVVSRPVSAPSIPYTPEPAYAATAGESALITQWERTDAANSRAHNAFLELNALFYETLAQVAAQPGLSGDFLPAIATPAHVPAYTVQRPAGDQVVFDRNACMEFAIGKIGRMLGQEFAPIDLYPTRVRLPDEPLMFVDRITALEGEPRSMGSGRVVTEHDVPHQGWYLDGGRMPTALSVEAGQADLFLSGYLGIDFKTQGLAMYRLLDAEVTFHRGLPVPGEVIRYDIRIDRFFRHGNPWFFHFHYDGAINGQPYITMRNGCAGFFTPAELEAGQGVVEPKIQLHVGETGLPGDWRELAPRNDIESYGAPQIEALRQGRLAACFGEAFARLPLERPLTLPSGKLQLVHRVIEMNPHGGKYGLGVIRAEADIHPDDWFITCHFVDDKVMPGTLMYECCLHTLRIHLMRLGWLGEEGACAWEPIPGVTSRLKCRGQVLESTRLVTYEVHLKRLYYGPEPSVVADARMYADGKPIVDINDMTVRLSGQTREGVEALWQALPAPANTPKPVLFTYEQILAYAEGKPSEAFGAPYTIFDEGRVLARLPRPPYLFMDRVTGLDAAPWMLKEGGTVESEYEVPVDAWYFDANRQPEMPFAVLLEIALQPCGWFAAYMGSALTSDVDLKFRNLGGVAVQHLPITRNSGTLTMHVKVTGISQSGGMIIQHFHMRLESDAGTVYEGTTYFGFFTAEALATQLGVQGVNPYRPTDAEVARAHSLPYPKNAPYPDTALRMVDTIALYIPDGGPHGLGFIRGEAQVDPGAWFFQAHFYQDPVCPGSLGLESFVQLMKHVACDRWGVDENGAFESPVLGERHEWVYRGQIIPKNKRIMVDAVITAVDDTTRTLRAEGFLKVDGLIIYQMKNFSLRYHRTAP